MQTPDVVPPDARISVVIPTLDEAAGVERALRSVERQSGPVELIVADGGSTDGTLEHVAAVSPDTLRVGAARGRARQLNAGAARASGDILLFLHADTALPAGALDTVRRAIAGGAVAGCFETRFDDARGWMRLWQARLWMRWHRFAFGDRALFARRDAFEAAGGFPDQPIFEDLDFVRAVRRHGRFAFLDLAVTTSARRFRRHGALRQQVRNVGLWVGWVAGVSPTRLKRHYPDAPEERG